MVDPDATYYCHCSLSYPSVLPSLNSTEESALMRKFFGIDSADRSKDSTVGSTSVDDLSCISSCSLGSGSVKNSLLSNVHCNQIDAEGCVLINVTANKITAKEGCIIYNIADGSAEGLDIIAGKVLAGVFSKDGSHKQMHSSIDTDGGTAPRLLSSVLYCTLLCTSVLLCCAHEIQSATDQIETVCLL
jgi:hypothetical protein